MVKLYKAGPSLQGPNRDLFIPRVGRRWARMRNEYLGAVFVFGCPSLLFIWLQWWTLAALFICFRGLCVFDMPEWLIKEYNNRG